MLSQSHHENITLHSLLSSFAEALRPIIQETVRQELSRAQTEDRLLDIPAAAERLGVKNRTVYAYIKQGHLEAVRMNGREGRIKESEIQRFVESRGHREPTAREFARGA